jgi:uridine phosphorylase
VAILRGAAGGSVGIAASPGIGAPAAAIAIEELVALGVRAITFIGYAAALEPGHIAGDVVAIDDALRDEGVSGLYGATGPVAAPDPDAAVALAQALEGAGLGDDHGRSWTTDALYRETPSAIARARGAGARVVEMEVAAVYAVAVALHVAIGGAVIVGDRIVDGRWDPPPRFEPIRRRARAAVDAVLDAWMSAPR